MKSLVVYSSQTGNTRQLAETIYQTLADGALLSSVEEAPDPADFDFVALGFWFQAGRPDPKSAAFLERLKGHQRVFLFATHGADPDTEYTRNAMAYAQSLAEGATIAGTFNCFGQVNPKVLEKAKAKPQPPAWINDAPRAVGHPNARDFEEVKSALQAALR
jgi:flavodoxin I